MASKRAADDDTRLPEAQAALRHVLRGELAPALDIIGRYGLFDDSGDFHREVSRALLKSSCHEPALRAFTDAGLRLDCDSVTEHLQWLFVRSNFDHRIHRVDDATLCLLLSHARPGDHLLPIGCNLLALALYGASLSTDKARMLVHVERHCDNKARWLSPSYLVYEIGSHVWCAARLFVGDTEVTVAELPALVRQHIQFASVETVIYVADRSLSSSIGLDWLRRWANDAKPTGDWFNVLCHYPYAEHSPEAVAWQAEVGRVLKSLQDQARGSVNEPIGW